MQDFNTRHEVFGSLLEAAEACVFLPEVSDSLLEAAKVQDFNTRSSTRRSRVLRRIASCEVPGQP